MKSKAIVITGGAGFIGSHLTDLLLSMGHVVTVVDNMSRSVRAYPDYANGNLHFLNLDLRTEQGAHEATVNQEVVFNLAALNTGIDYDSGHTNIMFEENMLLQMMPIRMAARNHVQTFIQISSASVYSKEVAEKNGLISETDLSGEPESSKLGYGLAKRMGENLASWYASIGSMKTIVARMNNVYGPGDHYDDMGHFIPVVIRKFYEAKDYVKIFGSGRQKRSFLHVADAISGLLLLAEKGTSGNAYNIDPIDEHSVMEIVDIIQNLMKKEHISVRYNPKEKEGSIHRVLNSDKIKSLGWKPKHALIHSLRETVEDVARRLQQKDDTSDRTV